VCTQVNSMCDAACLTQQREPGGVGDAVVDVPCGGV